MTIANFRATVAAFMNRSDASFTVNGQDIMLLAINDARRAAQRAHNFELLRVGMGTAGCFLTTSAGGANWQTGCTTQPAGAGNALMMKRIDSTWQFSTMTISGTSYSIPVARYPFDTSGDLKRNLPVVDTMFLLVNQPNPFVQTQFCFCIGPLLFLAGANVSTQNIMLFGIQFLPDLVGSEQPDVFLTYFTDWLRMATVFHLNTYIKDTEQFPLDVQKMKIAWDTVTTMDGDIANMGEQANLD